MEPIIEGKVKTVYQGVEEDQVLIHYHDRVTAGNGKKEDYPVGKGEINCDISCIIFEKLADEGIESHYIQRAGPGLMRCRKVEIIPIEVVVRNIAAGSIVRNTTIPEGKRFAPEPLIECFLKDDEKDDPLLNDARIMAMGYNGQKFMMISIARKVNVVLKEIFSSIDLDLVDFKLEFGAYDNRRIILADEISPDSCRLWKKGTTESMDKDLFRKDEGDIIEAYKEILAKLNTQNTESK